MLLVQWGSDEIRVRRALPPWSGADTATDLAADALLAGHAAAHRPRWRPPIRAGPPSRSRGAAHLAGKQVKPS